jgi:hypothetical protein
MLTRSSPPDAAPTGVVWLLIAPPVVLLLAGGLATIIEVRETSSAPVAEAVIQLVFGSLSVLAAFALLARRRLGWLLAVSIVGWHLAATLVLWWTGTPNYLSMALVALAAILVTSPDMRRAYASHGAR